MLPLFIHSFIRIVRIQQQSPHQLLSYHRFKEFEKSIALFVPDNEKNKRFLIKMWKIHFKLDLNIGKETKRFGKCLISFLIKQKVLAHHRSQQIIKMFEMIIGLGLKRTSCGKFDFQMIIQRHH